jgi:hypothetical protein
VLGVSGFTALALPLWLYRFGFTALALPLWLCRFKLCRE